MLKEVGHLLVPELRRLGGARSALDLVAVVFDEEVGLELFDKLQSEHGHLTVDAPGREEAVGVLAGIQAHAERHRVYEMIRFMLV